MSSVLTENLFKYAFLIAAETFPGLQERLFSHRAETRRSMFFAIQGPYIFYLELVTHRADTFCFDDPGEHWYHWCGGPDPFFLLFNNPFRFLWA